MSDIRVKDPSELNNTINGFDIMPCEGLTPGTIIIVIPNLGYGLLANLVARRAFYNKTVTPNDGFRYKINGIKADVDGKIESEPLVHTNIQGQEIFVPISGHVGSMFCTSFRVNSQCDDGTATLHNLHLPIPIKISPRNSSNYVNDLRLQMEVQSYHVALLKGAYEIAKNSETELVERLVEDAAAGQIMRAVSFLTTKDEENRWTGERDGTGNTGTLETIHLQSEQGESITNVFDRGIDSAEDTNLFARPFVGIYTLGEEDKPRIYYLKDLDDIINNNMRITGTSRPLKIELSPSIYLLDSKATELPSWASAKSEEDAATIGLSGDDYAMIASPIHRKSWLYPTNVIFPISNIVQFDYNSMMETHQAIRLHTVCPPLFTNGDYTLSRSKESFASILPFSKTYLLPIASGIGVQASVGSCRYCGGTGHAEDSTCLNCLDSPGWNQCPTCKGKDLSLATVADFNAATKVPANVVANESNLSNLRNKVSTGYISHPVTDIKLRTHYEKTQCSTCNPSQDSETYDSSKTYRPGYVPCTECDGTSKWDTGNCPECNGTGVCGEAPAPTANRVKALPDSAVAIQAPGDKIIIDVNTERIGFEPAMVTLFIDGKLLKSSVTSPKNNSYNIYTVSKTISGTTIRYTLTMNNTGKYTITSKDLRATMKINQLHGDTYSGGSTIQAYAVQRIPEDAPYGFVWDTDIGNLPTLSYRMIPENDVSEIVKFSFVDPDTAKTFSDPNADTYNDNFAEHEGFSHLAYTIDRYLDLVGSVQKYLESLSCSPIQSEDDLQYMRGMRITDKSNPYEDSLAMDTVGSKHSGTFDGLMLGPPSMISDQYLHTEHTTLLGANEPDTYKSYSDLNILFQQIDMNVRPYNTVEEQVFPYAIKYNATTMKATTGTPMEAGVPIEIPFGIGAGISKLQDPINQSSSATVGDDGIVSLLEILASAGSSNNKDNLKLAVEILDTIPRMVNHIIQTSDKMIVQVSNISTDTYSITSPYPRFAERGTLTAEFTGAESWPLKQDLEDIRTILTLGRSSTTGVDHSINMLSASYGGARATLKSALDNPKIDSTNGTEQANSSLGADKSIGDILQVLTVLNSIVSSAEFAKVVQNDSLDYTELYCTIAESDGKKGVLLQLPKDDGNGFNWTDKGLWFYNVRKSYLLLDSMINLVRAMMEKAYTLLSSHANAFSILPITSEGEERQIDLALYHGTDGTKKCYPIIPKDIDLTALDTDMVVSNIEKVFEDNTIYYDVNFSIPQTITAESDKVTPVIMGGMGLPISKFPDFSTQEQKYWRDGTPDSTLYKFDTALDAVFEKIRDSFGYKDHMTRPATGTLKYIDDKDTVSTVTYDTLEDIKTGIKAGNPSKMLYIQSKPQIKSKIDLAYVFPYISTATQNSEYSGNLSIKFLSAKPEIITDNIADGISISSLMENASKLNTVVDPTWKEANSGEKSDYDVFMNNVMLLAKRIKTQLTFGKLVQAKDDGKLDNIHMTIPFVGSADPSIDPRSRGESAVVRIAIRKLLGDEVSGLDDSKVKYNAGEYILGAAGWNELINPTTDAWKKTAIVPSGSFDENYNLHLSFRRSVVTTNYVIMLLCKLFPDPRGGDYTLKDTYDDLGLPSGFTPEVRIGDSTYKIWIYLAPTDDKDNTPETEVTKLQEIYGTAQHVDPATIVCYNPFSCYGFGSMFVKSSISNPDNSRNMRFVAVSYSNPTLSSNLKSMSIISPKDANDSNLAVSSTVPAGLDRYYADTSIAYTHLSPEHIDNVYIPELSKDSNYIASNISDKHLDDKTRTQTFGTLWMQHLKKAGGDTTITSAKMINLIKDKLKNEHEQARADIATQLERFVEQCFHSSNTNIFMPTQSFKRVWICAAKKID